MSAARYAGGLVLLVLFVGPPAWGAVRARRRLLPGWSGAPARLAEAVVTLAALVVVAQSLGAFGWFRPGPAALACVAAGVAVGLAAGPAAPARPLPAPPAPPRWSVVLAVVACAVVAAQWASWVRPALAGGITEYDSLHYHLPFAARFASDGWLTRLHPTTPGWPSMFHPANAEVFHAYGMLAFGRDLLSPLLNAGWAALAVLAGWCAGRPRGAGPPAVVAVTVFLGLPLIALSQAGAATNDVAAVALFLSAVALLLQPDRGPGATAVAALAAGVAVGMKLTLLGPVAALTVVVIAVAVRGTRLRTAARWLALLALPGAFWYVRNLAHAGSPLPAVDLGLLPHTSFDLLERFGFSVAHYATDLGVWRRAFRPGFRSSFGPAWPLVLVLAGAGALTAVRGRERLLRLLGVGSLLAALVYVLTPGTALGEEGQPRFFFTVNLRYAAPALVLATVLLAVVATGRRARVVVAVALGLALAATQTATDFDAWHGIGAREVAVGLLVAVGIGLVAVAGTRPVAVGVLAVALAVAGFALQRDYFDGRYAGEPAWAWADDVRDRRIAVAGFDRQYALHGVHLSNRVDYLGRVGPRGAFAHHRTCDDVRAALRAGRYDFFVFEDELEYRRFPEGEWVATGPAATEVLRHDGAVVYRVDWRRPAGPCPP